MTRDALGRACQLPGILRTPQKVYFAFQALFRWSKSATFDFGFASGTYRAIEPAFFSDDFMNLRPGAPVRCTTSVLRLIGLNLNTIKVGSPC
jgi:hypothetical protein